MQKRESFRAPHGTRWTDTALDTVKVLGLKNVKKFGDEPEYDTKLIDACQAILRAR